MAGGKVSRKDTESPSSEENVWFSKPTEPHRKEADIADCFPQTFYSLWRYEKCCDFALICGGEELKVHSLILYVDSPHISDLIDKFPQHDKVLVDCGSDLMTSCLEFVYRGRVEVTTEQLKRLQSCQLFL